MTNTSERYDVWIFGRLPKYVPRGGVASITSGLTLEEARAYRDKNTDANHYGLIYVAGTRRRVS
ncbi:hypothetical protein [Streptomyces halobius]|uniref:Uncharacterized protein n=1 Tax=Streptomyces halobius TaxID=2879846 RepID=A0ABY4M1Q4_9ACTN|nr:hypothetical protein [Streptomyces halobius]UQA91650.1 hypothetical protein K9S39_07045 [Streptomyces halobius]